MVEFNINTKSAEPISTSSVQPTSTNPALAGQAAQANKTKKDFDADTQIGSLAELKEKAPEVYKKMMEGIAFGIISKMRRNQERLEKMWRESRYT